MEKVEERKMGLVEMVEEVKKGEDVIMLMECMREVGWRKEVEDGMKGKESEEMRGGGGVKRLWGVMSGEMKRKNVVCVWMKWY